jgi:hypothetical protein
MTMSGRPLLDNPVDAALFVDREAELEELIAAVRMRFNCLVYGEPGSGKTSLLRALVYRARTSQAGMVAAYVRAEGSADGGELLGRVVQELTGSAARTVAEAAAPIEQYRRDVIADLERAGVKVGGDELRIVIVLDDVPAQAGHDLFGRWRDELWELGCEWVVAARGSERVGLSLPPADAFFERQLELDALPAAAAVEMLGLRHEFPAGWARRIVDTVGGNPRRVLDAARGVVEDGMSLDRLVDAVGRRDTAIHQLGRPAAMLAAELDALGAASASDRALLDKLGWTRPRVVQVLAQLEDAGLVTSAAVRAGPGRPRKVYRLMTPAEYLPAHKDAS